MSEQTITISLQEYKELKHKALYLECLEEYGVDSWYNYDDATAEYNTYLEKEEEEEN